MVKTKGWHSAVAKKRFLRRKKSKPVARKNIEPKGFKSKKKLFVSHRASLRNASIHFASTSSVATSPISVSKDFSESEEPSTGSARTSGSPPPAQPTPISGASTPAPSEIPIPSPSDLFLEGHRSIFD